MDSVRAHWHEMLDEANVPEGNTGRNARAYTAAALLVCVTGGFNHQRIALPATARITQPGAHPLAEVRSSVEWNDACVRPLLGKHHPPGRLHEIRRAVVAHDAGWHLVCDTTRTDVEVLPMSDVDVAARALIGRRVCAQIRISNRRGFGRHGRNPPVGRILDERC